MSKTKLALLLLFGAGASAVSWYFFYTASLATPSATSTALTYDFPVSNLPALTATDPDARYSLMLNPGDGRYIIEETQPGQLSATLTYAYRSPVSTAGYAPYLEATEIYDDKKPPPNAYRLVPTVTTTDPNVTLSLPYTLHPTQSSTTDSYKKILGDYPIRIEPARNIVSGHGSTYVVTFENLQTSGTCGAVSGDIIFKYDPNVLDFLQVKDGANPDTWSANETTGIITQPFSNLAAGEQRSIFFIFRTLENLPTGRQVIPSPTATLSVTGSTSCWWNRPGSVTDSVSSHNSVADSHDPNHKSASPGNFCTNYDGNLKFKIEFQNDGQAPAQWVTIEDELDALIPDASLVTDANVKAYIGGKKVNMPTDRIIRNGKKITFKIFTNGQLKGKKQSGYGTTIRDADTRGHLEFKIPADDLSSKPGCNAVCNRARITFDCNPPIETDLALARIGCNPCAPSSCDTCAICQDSVFFSTDTGSLNSPALQILPYDVISWLSQEGYSYYKWYPESSVSAVDNPAASADADRSTTYTLVASTSIPGSSCKRFVFHRRFEAPCDLTLTATATSQSTTGCPDSWLYTLDASVAGSGFNPNDLVWNRFVGGTSDCASAATSLHEVGVAPGLYYIAVTDTKTGCYDETWIDKRYNPIVIDDNPTDCVAELIVSGGQPGYTYEWEWDGGARAGRNTLSLRNKTNVSVTVTDANQCTAVFNPVRGDCRTIFGGGILNWVLGLVGALVIVYGIYRFVIKKRRP